jgi:hypothetical protein
LSIHGLREKIHEFSGKLSSPFSKPTGRFLEQMLYGIQTSREVKLSEVARSLGEDISLLKTETRLSRNLMEEDLEERLFCEIAQMGSRRVHRGTLLLIAPTEADFGLVFRGTQRKAIDIAMGCPMLYSGVIVRETEGGEKPCTI